MKIVRLDLRAFGGFSHQVFNFDPKKKIHVLYGENEAGKSSFTRALKALLFGIEKRSKDAYLHTQENLFLEGLIENESGKILQILRDNRSSRKQTQLLSKFFPKLNKQNFSSLFCLNQESIRMGSKDLLENIKRFDVSLFSSLQGAGGIVRLLKSIENDIEQLFKARGVKPYINQKIQSVSELLNNKKSQKLSSQLWNDLNQEKQSLVLESEKGTRELNHLLSLENDLKVAIDIFEIASKHESYQKLLKEFDPTQILKREHLEEYKQLTAALNELNSQKEKTNNYTIDLESKIEESSYDSKLVEIKNSLELLSKELKGYKDVLFRKDQYEKELQRLKAEFKKVNLSLQEKVNASISYKEWIVVRDSFNTIVEESKILGRLSKEKEEEIKRQSQKLQALKDQDEELPVYENLNELEEQIEFFDQGISLEEKVENFEKRIEQSVKKLNVPYTRVEFSKLISGKRKELEKSILEFSQIKPKYIELLTKVKLTEEKIGVLKSRKNEEKQINFEYYLEVKRNRQDLKQELFKPWTPSNYRQMHAFFMEYQNFIDMEDEIEAYYFSNMDVLVSYRKQLLDKEELREQLKEYRAEITPYKKKIEKFLKDYRDFLPETNLYEPNQVDFLYSHIEKVSEIATLVESWSSELGKLNAIKEKLSQYVKVQNPLFCQKEIFLKEFKEKNEENQYKSHVESQISFIFQSLESYKKELEEIKKKQKKHQSNWEKIAEKNGINFPFNPDEIVATIKNLDQFFELSNIITLKNNLIKNDLKLFQKFEDELKRVRDKSGFTDITFDNSRLYLEKALVESKKKIEHDKWTFLRANTLKGAKALSDTILKKNRGLENILKKISLTHSDDIINVVERSNQYHLIAQEDQKLQELLNFKCKPKKPSFYIEIQKEFRTIEPMQQKYTNLKRERLALTEKSETIQKKLGEIAYKEKEIVNFSKKYEIDEKLQEEGFGLNEKIDEYIISKVTERVIKKIIWDYQQSHQHAILKKAGEYFQRMTHGRYQRVQLNILNQKESFLICENQQGQKVTVDLLSEGARDQLFLSIKLSLAELYSKGGESPPLILDDVIVNFDEERSERFLDLLNTLSNEKQVILLTHHKHLLKLIENHKIKESSEIMNIESCQLT